MGFIKTIDGLNDLLTALPGDYPAAIYWLLHKAISSAVYTLEHEAYTKRADWQQIEKTVETFGVRFGMRNKVPYRGNNEAYGGDVVNFFDLKTFIRMEIASLVISIMPTSLL